MSQKSAEQFLEKLQNDPQFKRKLEQVKSEEEMQKILKENNLSFTKQECKIAAKSLMSKEVSDEDLKKIAGGGAIALKYLEE